MSRDFNEWFKTMRGSISSYDYYTDFDKVYENVDSLKVEINILNSLIGSKKIEEDFETILTKYPEVLKVIPILLAKREYDIFCMDEEGEINFIFNKKVQSIDEYKMFMRRTGLFDLMESHIINNLYDYILGIEVGLDSNARKNRGGHLMENLVEQYIQNAGFQKELNYYKELKLSKLEEMTGLNLKALSNEGTTEKRFDFVIIKGKEVYACECNFYASSGSKLNETARSYKTLALESKGIEHFHFVWFTDGTGWNDAKNNLKETFDVLDTIYNINDLINGALLTL